MILQLEWKTVPAWMIGFSSDTRADLIAGDPGIRCHMAEIVVAREVELADVATFYDECGYIGAPSGSEIVLAARDANQLLGAVRLCFEEDVIVLRGMQVRPGYERRGLGSQLLRACVPFLDARLSYCLPYTHLVSFYRAVSFEVAQPSQLPSFLAARLAAYLAEGHAVLAMRRASCNPAGRV